MNEQPQRIIYPLSTEIINGEEFIKINAEGKEYLIQKPITKQDQGSILKNPMNMIYLPAVFLAR